MHSDTLHLSNTHITLNTRIGCIVERLLAVSPMALCIWDTLSHQNTECLLSTRLARFQNAHDFKPSKVIVVLFFSSTHNVFFLLPNCVCCYVVWLISHTHTHKHTIDSAREKLNFNNNNNNQQREEKRILLRPKVLHTKSWVLHHFHSTLLPLYSFRSWT